MTRRYTRYADGRVVVTTLLARERKACFAAWCRESFVRRQPNFRLTTLDCGAVSALRMYLVLRRGAVDSLSQAGAPARAPPAAGGRGGGPPARGGGRARAGGPPPPPPPPPGPGGRPPPR